MSYRRVGPTTGNAASDLLGYQREAQAFELRCHGFSFEEIAERCGYANRSAAYKAYKRALSRVPKREIEEMRETIFGQQLFALKNLTQRIAKGDTFAVREMTMIHDRMAKLFGLDTPAADAGQLGAKVVVRAYPAAWVSALPTIDALATAPTPPVDAEPMPEAVSES